MKHNWLVFFVYLFISFYFIFFKKISLTTSVKERICCSCFLGLKNNFACGLCFEIYIYIYTSRIDQVGWHLAAQPTRNTKAVSLEEGNSSFSLVQTARVEDCRVYSMQVCNRFSNLGIILC